jgi:hypothetical protein
MTDEFLASESHRLLDDRVLLRAVANMRLEALEALATVQPDELVKYQARVYAADEFLTTLRRFIDAVED